MGNICSSCCTEKKDSYTRVPDDDRSVMQFDESVLRSSIFEGASVDQKFTQRHVYEERFVWVNLDPKEPKSKSTVDKNEEANDTRGTIHMSTHQTKDRRHKEASLADVTSVERGPPKKPKAASGEECLNCLTVNFQRGGGIDLRFSTDAECDLWYQVLNKIVNHYKLEDQASTPMQKVLQH